MVRAVGLPQQGSADKMEESNAVQDHFDKYLAGKLLMGPLLSASYDALPSAVNLHAWGKRETPSRFI